MKADTGVVLDACVLLPMPLADTLFRMAEEPRLYVPYWTDEIMEEVSRTLFRNSAPRRLRQNIANNKFGIPSRQHG